MVYFERNHISLTIDLNEIEELKYVDIDYLLKDIKDNPDRYTSWFKTALYMVIKALQL